MFFLNIESETSSFNSDFSGIARKKNLLKKSFLFPPCAATAAVRPTDAMRPRGGRQLAAVHARTCYLLDADLWHLWNIDANGYTCEAHIDIQLYIHL